MNEMTGCGDYSDHLRRYLDQELSNQERVQFLAHVKQCVVCSQDLEAEEELSRLLHRSRPLYTAPDSLRDRVQRITGEPLPEPLLDPPPKPGKR
jgi:mycothiol system anti-sigma-R factor